uniref:Uncharacterized protein n=1 Tax=Arcella intermedia TaxID=1963864 RepID=A0A6B2L9G4_9EUKA
MFESQEEKESLLKRGSQTEGLVAQLPERLSVFCLDVSGKTFASGGQDGIVKLWDEHAECLQRMEAHTETVCCLAFLTPTLLASGSVDKTIRLWHTPTGAPLATLTAHTSHIYALCPLHRPAEEGIQFASGSHDTTIKIWKIVLSKDQQKVQSCECLKTLEAHQRGVRCLIQVDDKLVSGGYDKSIKIWDLSSSLCEKEITTHSDAVICFCVVNFEVVEEERRVRKKWLCSGGLTLDKSVYVWDCDGWEMRGCLKGHGDGVLGLVYVGGLNVLVSGSMDNCIKFWDVESGECKRTIEKAHKWYIYSLKMLDLGEKQFLLSGSQDCSIKIWDIGV